MTPTEHAQLLDRLALALAEYDSANPYHDAAPLIARARQVAAEIEGWEVPTDEELQALWNDGDWFNDRDWFDEGATPSEFAAIARLVLARFGGGEGQP